MFAMTIPQHGLPPGWDRGPRLDDEGTPLCTQYCSGYRYRYGSRWCAASGKNTSAMNECPVFRPWKVTQIRIIDGRVTRRGRRRDPL